MPKTPEIIAVSGNSGLGKTTLLEMLIPELRKRGLRVLAVKHGKHFDFSESPVKDTERLWNAGADVAFLSDGFTFFSVRRELDLEELSRLSDADVILVEGFRNENVRKIVILDENSKVEDFKGEIVEVLRKEDVLSRRVDVGRLVELLLRG